MRLTEQKQAKQRASQAERLAAIGEMVAVLTHESRNSLQLSQANLDMLCLEIEDQPEALEYVSRIQMAQDRLQRLLEELREFAEPVCLYREPYNLRSLVGQVLNELSAVHAEKQIRLRQQAARVDLRCAVDVFRMRQVFRNILENSIAASPNPVRISVTWVSSELNGAPALQVALRDNGPGLSAEQKQKVFEPFYTTRKRRTGLGLAITRRIVEAHDGKIAAGGNDSEGAEFVITLPRGSAVQNNRHSAQADGRNDTISEENTMPTNMEANSPIEPGTTDRHVHGAVGRRIDECAYRFIFKNVSWRYAEGRLTLRGSVPTFYLKQVLQELMRDIDQVKQIVNHIDVISSVGLSSEPPNKPR